MSICIYLDESGDLGWKFDAPYRYGGSSKYLTISCLLTPKEKKDLPKHIVRKMYKKFKWNTKEKKKWSQMSLEEREYFAERADMLSGVIQGHFEDGNSTPWHILASSINARRLYFN